MKISRITISNFRSFGSQPVTVDLCDWTCFVGANGSGKSAILEAMCRLFGLSGAERTIVKADFHIPHDSEDEEVEKQSLSIEVRLEFPELGDEEATSILALPECFNQMIVEDVDTGPFCRVRLEATWTATNLPEGDVEQNLYWVTTPEGEADEMKQPMTVVQRSQIHAIYVPASRDPSRHLRAARGSVFGRLFRAVRWSPAIRSKLKDGAEEILDAFQDEPAIKSITEAIRKNWEELENLSAFDNPTLRPLNPRFEELVKNLELVFNAETEGRLGQIDQLSEGLQSLFYLALVGMMFDLEERLIKESIESESDESAEEDDEPEKEEDSNNDGENAEYGILLDRLNPPALVVLAIEEPENHLAPHYLGRIMQRLLRLSESPRGQVLLASHSPGILSRVRPTNVRYLRLDTERETEVHKIILPADEDAAFKYVNEAVRAYPELYFSNLVILGEGDSEQVVLPEVAKALGVPLDVNFVSFVPLGGRHVNHFWKLLSDLRIPHLTLLDLDVGRQGGGWGRVKYACKELLRLGVSRKELLEVTDDSGKRSTLSDHELERMHTWTVKNKEDFDHLKAWVSCLEKYGVFFSKPLDLDFALLRKFPETYKSLVEEGFGPSIPKPNSEDYQEMLSDVVTAVLRRDCSELVAYSTSGQELFFWYRYLFLGRGKPSTHFAAMSQLSAEELASETPSVLKRLIGTMKDKLGMDR
jgi:putative ATP-dependent endonuclease of OLD family